MKGTRRDGEGKKERGEEKGFFPIEFSIMSKKSPPGIHERYI